jgi:hypothetical protein
MREILDTLFVICIIKMIFAAPASLIILSLQFSIALLVLSVLGVAKWIAVQSFHVLIRGYRSSKNVT